MINLVTGGAGFLGSHLINKLMHDGEEVICLDNYITGRKKKYSEVDWESLFWINKTWRNWTN